VIIASIKFAAVNAWGSVPCLETLPLPALSLLKKNVLVRHTNNIYNCNIGSHKTRN